MLSRMNAWLGSFPFDQRSLQISARASRTTTVAGWGLLGALAAFRALAVRLPWGDWADLVALWAVVGGLLAYRGWRMPGVDFECAQASPNRCLRCANMPWMALMIGMGLSLVLRQVFLRQALHRNPLAAVFLMTAVLGEVLKARLGVDLSKEYRHHAQGWVYGAAFFAMLDGLSLGFDLPRLVFMFLFSFGMSWLYLHLSRAKASG